MKKFFLFVMFFFITFINVYADDVYVKSIKVDGKNLEGFTSDNVGPYTINVDGSKNSITLGYIFAPDYKAGQCSLGEIHLNYGLNELKCEVTKEDGSEARTYQINVNRPDNRSSDNSLTSLIVGNNKVVLTDENTYNVAVDSKTSSVEVKAVPVSGATLVDGYGERVGSNAIKLVGETTTIEVKVKAENDSVRTYVINIKKTDFRSNDATLKSLAIDGVDFEFKSDIYEYNLSVKYNMSIIKIDAEKNNENAILEYQGTVSLKNGINNIEIKVIAQDGSEKIYKLNITREEEIPIVSNIEIDNVYFIFNAKTYNYKIETTEEFLDFDVELRSETAHVDIIGNEDLKNGSIVKINAVDGEESVTYSFKIINNEEIEEEDEAKTEGNLNNQNDMLISLIVFGSGVISIVLAIIFKKKKAVK